MFGEGRSPEVNFARFDVSIPPDRELGSVKLPDPEAPDPATDFLVVDSTRISGQSEFVKEINHAMARDPGRNRDGVIFVHGYNTSFAEGLYRHAQLQHDMERHGASVHFSWPSTASTTNYLGDRESVLFSRDALEQAIEAMAQSRVERFNLVAHSMGTFLLMETMRTLAKEGNRAFFGKLNAVILMSADIDVEVFVKQAQPLLARNVPIYLLVSKKDRALFLSAVLRGSQSRVGSVTSTEQLGGLDVVIIDLTEIDAEEMLGHFKEGNSPALVEFVRKVHESGGEVFNEGQTKGVLGSSVALFQGGSGVRVAPATGW